MLQRRASRPVDSAHHLRAQPQIRLFGPDESLTDRLRRDGAHDVLALAEAELDRRRWAAYRVRRCYTAPARAWRAVDTVTSGNRTETGDVLGRIAAQLRIPVTGTRSRSSSSPASR
ncbi:MULTISPECIES: hypothetical protein [Nocardia]|uniref:hypothetical protein n=1 Tax=Nocardia TaxID=1817 RepID=UPI00237D8052|nr:MULTISPECIES: hypothetical protein [Nocardia]MDE1674656.1 hypothetical protein [Nocardia gipuzkoensis]